MDFEVSPNFEDEQQFWNELENVVSKHCDTYDLIDDTLRSFLNLATTSRGKGITTDYDIARCSFVLLSSSLFEKHENYVRRQIVHCLLQEDDLYNLLFVTSFLLLDIRESEATAQLLNDEGAFTRLVDLISRRGQNDDAILHRTLMELLYEMSRIQQIKADDLVRVDDAFVCELFELIEELSNDVNDPYHYPIIRVLLVLNEQFMVSAHDPNITGESLPPLTNKVIKVLASQGRNFKTFGENLILLLNRESETSLQLLTLKLLYLLFTTPSTQEYFYTNDLRVLVDILIRNLLDLPSDATALRHTYLRVMYPLLAHTQLRQPPHYKCEEIRKLLAVLAGGQPVLENGDDNAASPLWGHFEEADETTKRLVSRCRTVIWLKDPETTDSDVRAAIDNSTETSPVDVVSGEKVPPIPPIPRKLRKRNTSKTAAGFLAPQLESARESALSVLEVASQREKPGVITPSRKASLRGVASKKEKPQPPRARRSTWCRRLKEMEPGPLQHGTNDVTGRGTADTQIHNERALEASALTPELPEVPQPGPPVKKPPPAPKARRWRGKPRKKEDEGGGVETNFDSDSLPPTPRVPVEKTLSASKAGSRASVAEALSNVQIEAMDCITEALERANIGSPSALEAKTVLAPPSPAPRRGVPGPTFSLERSPFIGEDEDD